MMWTSWYDIPLAVLLDFLAGDPRWIPHPVRGIGKLAGMLEAFSRRFFRGEMSAGFFTWFITILLSGGAALGLLFLAGFIHPVVQACLRVYLIYVTIATRDLVEHSLRIYKPLSREDLPAAKAAVSMIVSRETRNLEREGVVRAAVESVAENASDASIAPLIYAAIGGPVLAIIYRCVNTMDAMFGYRNDRYFKFGRIPARADDVFNWLPARVSGVLICAGALLTGKNFRRAVKVLVRDARKHDSPNAGFPEAAMAGALRIQLGGPSEYFGKIKNKPFIGNQSEIPRADHIKEADILLIAAVLLIAAITGGVLFILS
jgi:adenosylcobinamide-phosphate synthase